MKSQRSKRATPSMYFIWFWISTIWLALLPTFFILIKRAVIFKFELLVILMLYFMIRFLSDPQAVMGVIGGWYTPMESPEMYAANRHTLVVQLARNVADRLLCFVESLLTRYTQLQWSILQDSFFENASEGASIYFSQHVACWSFFREQYPTRIIFLFKRNFSFSTLN